MTKSQNTKNEQQKDLCITSEQLTEQWKKGELPEGHYYIKTHSETNIDEYIQWYKDHGIPSEKSFAYFNVTEVLDKVPSYEVWMEKTKSLKVLAEAYCKEKQQNKQLKELLKECREVIKNVDMYYGNYDATKGYLVINKIEKVLRCGNIK